MAAAHEIHRAQIAFAREDEDFAKRLVEGLAARGVEAEAAGASGGRATTGSESVVFVPVSSPPALASEWWRTEVRRAVDERRRIVPVLWRDPGEAEIITELADYRPVDFRNHDRFEPALDELVEAIKAPGAEPPVAEAEPLVGETEPPEVGQAGPTDAAEAEPPDSEVVTLQWEGASAPVDLACTPDAAALLHRAAELGQRHNESFDLSFTTVLLAFLVPETELGRWFRRWAEDGNLSIPRLLERADLADPSELTDPTGAPASPATTPYLITASVNNLVTRARDLADTTGPEGRAGPVALRHVMGGLLYNPTFHVQDWEALAVDREAWSEAFLWQVWKGHLQELEAWKKQHREAFQAEPDVPEGPSTHIATDVWTTRDALGYEAYAYALARFITHGQTRPPLTISVQAPWGGGKTSLMRMIQQELDPDWSADIGEDRVQPRGVLTVAQLLGEVDEWIGANAQRPLPRIAEGPWPRLLASWYADAKLDDEAQRRARQRSPSVRAAYERARRVAEDLEQWVEPNRGRPLRGPDAPETRELTRLDGWVRDLRRIRNAGENDHPANTVDEALNAVNKALDDMAPWVRDHAEEALPPPGAVPDRLTVWFNAWKYENTSQVWAGLADAIIHQIAARLSPLERERFWLRLNFSRIDADKVRLAVHDRIFARFWSRFRAVLVGLVGVVVTAGAALAAGALSDVDWALCGGALGTGGSIVLAALTGVVELFRARKGVEAEPASVSLSSFLDIPDYESELGFVHHVRADLQRVFAAVPDRYLPLVVFVDDLDRCSPTKVAQVVEAVNLFLAGELPQCIFVLGMDTEMVAAALQAAHEDVIAQLPADAGTPIGWKFMDKFVQLPFLIPPAEDDDLLTYTKRLFTGDGAESDDGPSAGAGDVLPRGPTAGRRATIAAEDDGPAPLASSEEDAGDGRTALPEEIGRSPERARLESLRGRIDTEIQKFSDRNPEIRRLVADAGVHFQGNPRELKRFVNVFRLHYFLWAVRRSRGRTVPTMPQLVRWSVFSMRWPEVTRWLRRGGQGEWEERRGEGEFVSRLIVLEGIATDAADASAWRKAVAQRFQFEDNAPRWLEDDDLWLFLRERTDEFGEPLLLSEGAQKGLW